jgi:ribosomal protein L29
MSLKFDEIKTKSRQELLDLLEKTKKESFSLRFRLKSSSLTQTSSVSLNRRFLARILTRLNQLSSR